MTIINFEKGLYVLKTYEVSLLYVRGRNLIVFTKNEDLQFQCIRWFRLQKTTYAYVSRYTFVFIFLI